MLISVIIPVYNHAHVLRRTFMSLSQQTHKELEIIVVNDGSTDNFAEVMKEILFSPEFKDLNIKVIDQANAGAPAARNRGFSESHGEMVVFWDADTIGDPSMLQKMTQALVSHPEANFAYSGFKFGFKTFLGREYSAEALKKINYIDVTSLVRRADFPGFDEKIKKFQDWDLWLTMSEQGKSGVYVPEILYKKITLGRAGISTWLPSFFYKLPFKTKLVKKYDAAKKIIQEKHGIEF